MEPGPRINRPGFEVPPNTIAVVCPDDASRETLPQILEGLRGQRSRPWFNTHAYYCLPLVIGNQYGYIIRSLYDVDVVWDGGRGTDATEVRFLEPDRGHQYIRSHFGDGIVTVQNRFHFRTPPGINLMTLAPPNFVMPAVTHLMGVVEADNLERDFTFNFKVNVAGHVVSIRRGDPIGAMIPIPRGFVDAHELVPAETLFPPEALEHEKKAGDELGRLRREVDADKSHAAGRLYYKGRDAWGVPFPSHQEKIKR